MKIGERASSSPAPSYARSFLSQWGAGSKPAGSVDPQGLPRRTKVTLGRWVRAPDGQWISFWDLGIALFSLPHCSFLRSRNAAPSQSIPPRSVPFVHLWPFCLCSPPGEPLGGEALSCPLRELLGFPHCSGPFRRKGQDLFTAVFAGRGDGHGGLSRGQRLLCNSQREPANLGRCTGGVCRLAVLQLARQAQHHLLREFLLASLLLCL